MRRLKWLLGKPKDLRDAGVFHHLSLVALLAWVGLGADGLSSSSYGPEEAFRALAGHEYLAVPLAAVMAFTVFILSASYSRIIDLFPAGGGGYAVASKLLGERVGSISGCALLVDYVLTISISVAAAANAIFALLPPSFEGFRLSAGVASIALLILLNLRGVKESVVILTPIFVAFVATHAIVILTVIGQHVSEVGEVASQVASGASRDHGALGIWGIGLLLMRAYALGGGTYTGIEAVSNGLAIMREPRAQTGKRTMLLMGISLAFVATGILLCYLLLELRPSGSEPMNAVLVKQFASGWTVAGLEIGEAFVVLTLLSEGALLLVAAQTGFIDGPRVMANMAIDSWLPHQLSALSEQLTIRNGIYLMGVAALATLLYTHGNVSQLVVLYSINVFVTFTLSNLAMTRHSLRGRASAARWRGSFALHASAALVCALVLLVTTFEKFMDGGWLTLVVTSGVVALAWAIRRHYRSIGSKLRRLDIDLSAEIVTSTPGVVLAPAGEMDPEAPTAVVLVGSYSGLGLHTLLQIQRTFPEQYGQAIFISIGVVDSGVFKGAEQLAALRASVEHDLRRYTEFARTKLGWIADHDLAVGTDTVFELERLCRQIYLRFPRCVFFAGQLVARRPTWWYRLLHNETAYALQRRLQFDRLPMVILPTRVL